MEIKSSVDKSQTILPLFLDEFDFPRREIRKRNQFSLLLECLFCIPRLTRFITTLLADKHPNEERMFQ
jgi:hypothetical protein